MRILGISAYYHDAAAALVQDGRVIAAAQEERFTRKKHDSSFPHHAIAACLKGAGMHLRHVDRIAFYDKPFLKFERLLETYLAFAPKGFASFRQAMPLWVKDKLFQKNNLVKELDSIEAGDWDEKLLFSEHHLSHAASAFYPSPFERAAVLTMDGVGEWTTTSVAIGEGRDLKVRQEIHFPHSLGLLYSAFTYYTGFKVNSGEYKVMGLAPYGEPKYADMIKDHLIDIKDDGSFRLNLDYFDYCTGLTMTNEKFDALFGGPPRRAEDRLTQREMDLAASVQAVTEEVVLKLAQGIATENGEKNLCLAGGVALNCVANGKLARAGIFDKLWLQPAAGDAGGALGAALVGYYLHEQKQRKIEPGLDGMHGGYLGPDFSNAEIQSRLTRAGAVFDVLDDAALLEASAGALSEGKALGWFQGRMEFGPRALGARSILGDARSPSMQKQLNLKVKYRESFRPFAPAVLAEDARQVLRHRLREPVHAAGGRRQRAAPHRDERGGGGAVRDRQAEHPPIRHPCCHSRGLLRTHSDGAQGNESALPFLDREIQGKDELSGGGQHQLQRARRADRRLARRTPSAASWAPRSRPSRSATASCARRSRTRR